MADKEVTAIELKLDPSATNKLPAVFVPIVMSSPVTVRSPVTVKFPPNEPLPLAEKVVAVTSEKVSVPDSKPLTSDLRLLNSCLNSSRVLLVDIVDAVIAISFYPIKFLTYL